MHPTMVELLARAQQVDMEREIRMIHLQRLSSADRIGIGRRLLGAVGQLLIDAGTWLNRQANNSLNGCANTACENRNGSVSSA